MGNRKAGRREGFLGRALWRGARLIQRMRVGLRSPARIVPKCARLWIGRSAPCSLKTLPAFLVRQPKSSRGGCHALKPWSETPRVETPSGQGRAYARGTSGSESCAGGATRRRSVDSECVGRVIEPRKETVRGRHRQEGGRQHQTKGWLEPRSESRARAQKGFLESWEISSVPSVGRYGVDKETKRRRGRREVGAS